VKKKYFATGAVFLSMALIGQASSAKNLEDVFKEKG
jgi:hypothetical protein